MVNKNLVGIAKNRKPRNSTIVEEKKKEKLTPEEERNAKAKAKVEELLHDSPIVTLDKKKENEKKVETKEEEPVVEQPKGVEWLEEQVQILSDENQALVDELNMIKSTGSGDNSEVVNAVVALFNELQNNHIKLGMNQQTGVGNFRIYCPGFLNRMIKFFPFLEEYKRYQ